MQVLFASSPLFAHAHDMDTLRFHTTTAAHLEAVVPRWPPPQTHNPLLPSATFMAFEKALTLWHDQIVRDSTRVSEHARDVAAFLREADALDRAWGLP